ncbi:MAG: 5-dehydro-4-deoxy-D-glucuronate isomerase [Armatimonadetes bacterium]|nr:5-dehydro-4-deoxy-D-glucuronate isomerase [Armatimonadota bacterium]
MEIRHPIHPDNGKALDTEGLRREFLIPELFSSGAIKLVYSHFDRIIVGGAVPTSAPLPLEVEKAVIGSDHLLDSRELGILNLGGDGSAIVDGKHYPLGRLDALYVGRGTRSVALASRSAASPARFYLLSAVAHKELPTTLIGREKAKQVTAGSPEECNRRTINQVIHPDVVASCNLTMGYTRLEPASVWNTMPCHTHPRRMEVYFYFDVPQSAVVFHLMGTPTETRHSVVRNEQGIISPSWSIHSGVGTAGYSFVWGMAGENQTFTDMDAVAMDTLQ